MTHTMGVLLAISFIVSLIALGVLIWAVANKLIFADKRDATSIFMDGELGHPDDSDAFGKSNEKETHQYDVARAGIDRVGKGPVLFLLSTGVAWLVIGSVFGLIASLKMHWPDWLAHSAPLSFGRARTLHLNMVIYGWLSGAGIGVVLWLLPRIFHTPLRYPKLVYFGGFVWTIALVAGTVSVGAGWSDGVEWLEIPWQIASLLAIAVLCFAIAGIATAANRQVRHIYVSGWYFLAGLVWFPFMYVIANIPYLHMGTQQTTMNWWFAHNVLGLWLTPIGVGAAYYIIPKIIGKPVYSYSVSLLGFWGLALFYSQVGIHHIIGGPVPTWVVTLSIVHSLMMFVPVIAVAINHHVTVAQNLWAVRQSMALRFVALGALMYTIVSFQGSLQALRSVNSVTHFTHFTVAHAHLGVYAFVTWVLFGTVYYLMPHFMGRSWPYPKLITLHFWLVVGGFAIYFTALTVGGWIQGLYLLEPTTHFGEMTQAMLHYLEGRSVGGAFMTLGHFVFAGHFFAMLRAPRAATSTPAASSLAKEGYYE